MATLVKSYKGYKIKATTPRDRSTFNYWVIKPSWDTINPVWECDSISECIEFINSDKEEL